MSAALTPQPDDWQVAEHEPPIEDHAARAAQHAQAASVHSMAAMGAAHQAGMSAEAGKAMMAQMGEQMQSSVAEAAAWRHHVEQMVMHATQLAQDALHAQREVLSSVAGMIEVTQRLSGSMEIVAHAVMAPRKIVVTQRGTDGAISEAVSHTEGQ